MSGKTYLIEFTAIELEALRVAKLPVLAEDTSSRTLMMKIARAKVLASADREFTPVCHDCLEPWAAHGTDDNDPDHTGVSNGACILSPCLNCSGMGCDSCGRRGGPGPSGSTVGWKTSF